MAGSIIAKTISQEVVTGTTQPIYLGGTATDGSDAPIQISSGKVANLNAGTTVGGNPVASQSFANSLLAEYTVTGKSVSSINFSGLDINTHKSYRVEIEWNNAYSGGTSIYMFVNGDTTITNYYIQLINANITSLSAGRYNLPEILTSGGLLRVSTVATINLVNGYVKCFSPTLLYDGSNTAIQIYAYSKIASVSNITQLTFTSTFAGAIGVGSKIRIYRGDV